MNAKSATADAAVDLMIAQVVEDASQRYHQTIKEAVDEWVTKQEFTIQTDINRRLEKHRDHIILKLLGFDSSYGMDSLKIDHCNGRSGNSPLGLAFGELLGDALKTWLHDQMGELPTLDQPTIKSLHQEYLSQLRTAIQKNIRLDAENTAKKLVAQWSAQTMSEAQPV